jgi:hypothetical protein
MAEDETTPQEIVEMLAMSTGLDPEGVTLRQLLYESPILPAAHIAGALRLKGTLTEDDGEELLQLVGAVIGMFDRLKKGDELARHQLNLITKIAFPKTFGMPLSAIESLARKYRSGHVKRGFDVRKLMYKLSDIVVPVHSTSKDALDGAILIATTPEAQQHSLYSDALKNWRRGTTLQMLAIRIYLEKLGGKDEGTVVDERTLKRDLKKLREWEKSDPQHMLHMERAASAIGGNWKTRFPLYRHPETMVVSAPLPPSKPGKSKKISDQTDTQTPKKIYPKGRGKSS